MTAPADGREEGAAAAAAGPAPLRVRAAFAGRGQVFDGPRPLADVTYALKSVEDGRELDGRAPAGASQPPDAFGHADVYGLVRSSGSAALDGYVGSPLLLRLEDGRALPFTVTKTLGPTTYLIQALGHFI